MPADDVSKLKAAVLCSAEAQRLMHAALLLEFVAVKVTDNAVCGVDSSW